MPRSRILRRASKQQISRFARNDEPCALLSEPHPTFPFRAEGEESVFCWSDTTATIPAEQYSLTSRSRHFIVKSSVIRAGTFRSLMQSG